MSDEWCLIESDPGVFAELVSDIGVKGVLFDEVFDLDFLSQESTASAGKDVHGLIFLFKHRGAAEKSTRVSEYPPPGLFFAKQVITNACATQAILSVLLNADVKDLGTELMQFKEFTAK